MESVPATSRDALLYGCSRVVAAQRIERDGHESRSVQVDLPRRPLWAVRFGHPHGPECWYRPYSIFRGSDLVGRASAFKRMVEGGMAVSEAVALSGLVAADE